MPSQKAANKLAKSFTSLGILLILISAVIAILTFLPVAKEEISYAFRPKNITAEIVPVDTDFGIVIPKLNANSKVITNVDPFDSRIYQIALTQGVAHARGTGLPGAPGNVFLFSHSSVNFYEASRYNSVFYLLTKLELDDEIQIYYQGNKYTYTIRNKSIVLPTDGRRGQRLSVFLSLRSVKLTNR